MATSVIINGSTYSIPDQGQSPPWGSDLHDLLLALVNSANSVSGPSDIPLTNFNPANNQSAPANLTGASFDTSQVRAFIMQYSIYRSTNSNEESEVGVLYGTYKSVAGTWDMSQTYGGSSGIKFSISNGGQVSYTSTNLAGSSYSAKIKFSAKTFLQT